MSSKKIWTPQPRQAEMLARAEDEGLYGGAAGGGKSDYLLIEALRQVHLSYYRALILRKTVAELKQLIERASVYYKAAYPSLSYNSTLRTFTFPSGAKIEFSSLYHSEDKLKFQGLQYDFVGFDELTQFLQDEYEYLLSRNRANGPATRVYVRATANPGGVGHGWVKKYFIEAGPAGKTIWEKVTARNPHGKVLEFYKSKIFISSSVFDNQILLNNDPRYLMRLASLPEAERNALLYGDWNTFSGQVFTEFVNDSNHYRDRIFTHVIDPFEVPSGWKIIRSLDWGYSKPFAVGWYAIDWDGRYYRIREYYGCVKNQPNKGVKMTFDELAKNIKQIENNDSLLKNKKIIGVADPAIFSEDGSGSSIANSMAKLGVYFDKGDHQRLAGKMQCHYRFAFDEHGIPLFYCFSTCQDFMRTIKNLVYSKKNVEDIDTDCEDHIYDEMRYAFMLNVIQPRKNYKTKTIEFDPLQLSKGVC